MVLDRENHRVGRGHEGAFFDGEEDLPEAYLGGEGVAVVDDREAVISVPAVQLDTAAAGQQDLDSLTSTKCLPISVNNLSVKLNRGLAFQLVAGEVGVVGGGDVVVGERLGKRWNITTVNAVGLHFGRLVVSLPVYVIF